MSARIMKVQRFTRLRRMPKKTGTMTPQERIFAQEYAAIGDAQRAAVAAGYQAPKASGYKALARPAVASEIVRLQTERLTNEVLPLAVDVHIRLLKDPRTPGGVLVQAVKVAYERALGTGAAEGKEPHEMTADEIATALQALKREASNRAKPVIEPSVLD